MQSSVSFDPGLVHKVLSDLLKAIKTHELASFEIIDSGDDKEPKNVSPVAVEYNALGFQSWALPYVLPYAHSHVVTNASNNLTEKDAVCILAVNLFNPDMGTAWNRRREQVLQGRLDFNHELLINRLVLTWAPKCSEALSYRKWLLSFKLRNGVDFNAKFAMLPEELTLLDTLADKYPSNYHAWAYRKWCMLTIQRIPKSCCPHRATTDFTETDLLEMFLSTNLTSYRDELGRNSTFIKAHVSDHCGLSYRSFIIDQIFQLIYSYKAVGNPPTVFDMDCASKLFLFVASEMKEALSNLALCKDLVVSSHLSKLEKKLSAFDIELAFLLRERRTNKELIQFYEGHESLWCYRKYVFHKILSTVKEFKGNLILSLVWNDIISDEVEFLIGAEKAVETAGNVRIIKNYKNFLKNVLKINLEI